VVSKSLECDVFPSVLDTWLGDKKGIWPIKSWMLVGGDDVIGVLHFLQLQLSPPSSLAPIKSRMETFWYCLPGLSWKMSFKQGSSSVSSFKCVTTHYRGIRELFWPRCREGGEVVC